MTIKELINELQTILETTECNPNTEVLLGTSDIGNCIKKAFYNSGDENSLWHGEFVVLE